MAIEPQEEFDFAREAKRPQRLAHLSAGMVHQKEPTASSNNSLDVTTREYWKKQGYNEEVLDGMEKLGYICGEPSTKPRN